MPSNVAEEITMTNGTDPSSMTGQERMAEVSMLLSLAMMRLWLKRRGGTCHPALRERAFSRGYSLGFDAESRPPVAAGKP